tara:strand:+ start:39 stop:563 length:525 start_codon:yes stop_codon:yes gene_type:complete
MNVKIKKVHANAKIPTYGKPGDAGMDLTCVTVSYADGCIVYDTGIQIEIPEGYVGLLFPRSSLSKLDIMLTNHVGVIDSGYRGNIMFKYKPTKEHYDAAKNLINFKIDIDSGKFNYHATKEHEYYKYSNSSTCYAVGDRIGQIIILPYPQITFEETEELSVTERGTGGYGSTGK